MRKYLLLFLVAGLALGFVFSVLDINVDPANAAFTPSQLFPLTVKSVFGTDHIRKAFPTASQYSAPLKSFAGRYFDGRDRGGNNTGLGFEWYQLMGTSVAGGGAGDTVKVSGNRIYALLGGTLAAYNKDTFIGRLANSANSSLAVFEGTREHNSRPLNQQYDHGTVPWDAYLYPEHKDNAWLFPHIDNHTGLSAFDIDDRGYIYFIDVFGFGIARDESSILRILTQVVDSAATDTPLPTLRSAANGTIKITSMNGYGQPAFSYDKVTTVKAGGRYYAVITGNGGSSGGKTGTRILDVTEPTDPKFVRSAPEESIQALAQSGNVVAATVLVGNAASMKYEVRIYDAADFIAGSAPKKVFSAGADLADGKYAPVYAGLAVDKTSGKFYSVHYSSAPRPSSSIPAYNSPIASLSVFAPGTGGGAASYAEQKYALSAESMGGKSSTGPSWAGYSYIYSVEGLDYKDGYLVSRGLASGSGLTTLADVKMWTFQSGEPKELDTKGFIGSYYNASDYFLRATVQVIGGKDYLFVNSYELADVYELNPGSGSGSGGGTSTSTPSGPIPILRGSACLERYQYLCDQVMQLTKRICALAPSFCERPKESL